MEEWLIEERLAEKRKEGGGLTSRLNGGLTPPADTHNLD